MQELKCPSCGHVFPIDVTEYDSIASQVRNIEFEREVEKRVAESEEAMQARKQLEIQTAVSTARQEYDVQREKLNKDLAEANAEIAHLRSEVELAVAKKVREESFKREELVRQLGEAQNNIVLLKSEVSLAKQRGEMEVMTAVQLQKQKDDEALLVVKSDLERQLMQANTQLEYYKDLKTRMSTKMVGETLEQHCLTQFNQIRATAFPTAYFEKDNDVSKSGSKGDFIYREEVDGVELISIMFEMKNEMDTTATKHKNEDFFKELDRDRKEKKCEYAVLVSMLEADSDLYNIGIVDVSYRYPKMYVVRPQFFIPMITVLRNAALNAMEARRELVKVRNMNIDITHFEDNLTVFHDQMARNYELASRQFEDAIAQIDKSIDGLQKVKQNLLSSQRNVRLLNDKSQALTIQKLTKDAPSVRAMFDALHE